MTNFKHRILKQKQSDDEANIGKTLSNLKISWVQPLPGGTGATAGHWDAQTLKNKFKNDLQDNCTLLNTTQSSQSYQGLKTRKIYPPPHPHTHWALGYRKVVLNPKFGRFQNDSKVNVLWIRTVYYNYGTVSIISHLRDFLPNMWYIIQNIW